MSKKISYKESRKNNVLDSFLDQREKKMENEKQETKQEEKQETKVEEKQETKVEEKQETKVEEKQEKKESDDLNWDNAIKSSKYVKLEEDVEKILILANIKLVKRDAKSQFQPNEIEVFADVLEEDGKKVENKIFNTVSKRLKIKLKPILENKKASDTVAISILQLGSGFESQYSVKNLNKFFMEKAI